MILKLLSFLFYSQKVLFIETSTGLCGYTYRM